MLARRKKQVNHQGKKNGNPFQIQDTYFLKGIKRLVMLGERTKEEAAV